MSFINKEFKKLNLQMLPTACTDYLEALKSFNRFLVRCVGPKGKMKVVESEGGIKILTSSSKRLVGWIDLNDPVLVVIANAMKGQWQMYSDFGLFTGIASTYLLQNSLTSSMKTSVTTSLINYLGSVCISLLKSPNICVKIDFSSLKNLTQVTQTVITSKPLCCSPSWMDVNTLTACVVKGFIHGYSEEKATLGRVSVVVEDGPVSAPPSVFTGVLYPSPDINSERKWKTEDKNILVVLFAVNLSSSNTSADDDKALNLMELLELISGINQSLILEDYIKLAEGCRQVLDRILLERIESTCEKFLQAGVSVFACQKVVHPWIQFMLQRRGALVMERMGKDLADSFAALSEAVPLGDINIDDIPDGCIGKIEEIEYIVRGDKSYLYLKRESIEGGVATILVSAPGEEEAAELKVTIHQSLQSICNLITEPFVFPGSGCLEVWLAEELQLAILHDFDKYCRDCGSSKYEMLTALKWFRSTLFNLSSHISGSAGPTIVMDSVYHHRWPEVGANECSCGLINRTLCETHNSNWTQIEIDTIEERFSVSIPVNKWVDVNDRKESHKIMTPPLKLADLAHIDVKCSKLNAYRLALETCKSILSIGMVVY